MKYVVVLGLVAALSMGCTSTAPIDLVYIADMSQSIPASTRGTVLGLPGQMIHGFDRGSTIWIMGVTSDAGIEASDRTLYFHLAEQREPYDEDLVRLSDDIDKALRGQTDAVAKSPYPNTDLIGTLRSAAEKIPVGSKKRRRVVICLSDFVNDTSGLNFKSDPRLANEEKASALAIELAGVDKKRDFEGVAVFLGSVASTDLQRIPEPRRAAIRTFWTEFVRSEGGAPEFATDGINQVMLFLQKQSAKEGG